MGEYVSQELLDKYHITEQVLGEYLQLYGKTLHVFSCMSLPAQMAWCEEAAAYEMQQKELKRRKERKL